MPMRGGGGLDLAAQADAVEGAAEKFGKRGKFGSARPNPFKRGGKKGRGGKGGKMKGGRRGGNSFAKGAC